MSATPIEHVELSLPDLAKKLIDEFKVYQSPVTGRVTCADQITCFVNVARIDFRVDPNQLPEPVRKLYDVAKESEPGESCSFEILVKALDHIVMG